MATARVPQRIDEGGPRLVDRRQAGGAHGGLRVGLGRRIRAVVEPGQVPSRDVSLSPVRRGPSGLDGLIGAVRTRLSRDPASGATIDPLDCRLVWRGRPERAAYKQGAALRGGVPPAGDLIPAGEVRWRESAWRKASGY